jgi:predicted GNAT family N-acyltransferase
VREARAQREIEAALRLRRQVFCVEQGVDPAADQDGLDDQALHLLALDGERVVGTCRVLISGGVARLGRMAVEPHLRGRGTGAAILAEAERVARAAGAAEVRLHAQVAAMRLYKRAGYEPQGAVFVEEGIEHQTMHRTLA